MLDHYSNPRPFTQDEVEAHFTADYLAMVAPEMVTALLNQFREAAHPITPGEVVHHSPTRATWYVIDRDGLRRRINCSIEPAPPGRLNFMIARTDDVSPRGVRIRDARPDDALALAELERAARWELGDVALVTDRGDDYFAQGRLLDRATVAVAEIDGQMVGTLAAVSHRAVVDGVSYDAVCVEHARVHPDHQGKGILKQLSGRMLDLLWEFDARLSYSFVHPDNAALQAAASRMFQTKWQVRPCVLTFEADGEVARPDGVRNATPEDLPWVADVINTHHNGEILWSLCTAASLRQRLSREPDDYALTDLWICGGAVAGVWAADRHTSVVRFGPDETTVRRDAVVADYGFQPGAGKDLTRLLHWLASERRAQGTTGLLLLTSLGTPTHGALEGSAASLHPMEMYCQPVAEPPRSTEVGIYVDPLRIPVQSFGAG